MSAKENGGNGEEKKPAKSLSWQSILKSLVAGGVAGGV